MKYGLFAAIGIAGTAIILYAGLMTTATRKSDGSVVSRQVQVTPTHTPATSVNDASERARTIDVVTLPITFFIQSASLIAKVQVDAITPAFFNTANGTAPAVPLAIDDPLQDDDPGWKIQRLAVLSPSVVYKGETESTKYVMMIQGGQVGNHVWDVGGITESRLQVGDTAMVFVIGGVFDGSITVGSDIPWIDRAAIMINAINQSGGSGRFIAPEAILRYDLSAQTARSEETNEQFTISGLETVVASVLSSPTPTPTP